MILTYPAPPPPVYQQHVTVRLAFKDNAPVCRLHTPRGWVTVRCREDCGTEDGGPAPLGPEPDISHPDTIEDLVIVSPPFLPVYFRRAGDAR